MANPRPGHMHLGVFFNHTGHHIASWRHPGAQADAAINIEHYVEITQRAERAGLDFIFFADSAAVREARPESLSRSAQYTAYFEPITLLSALAMVTQRIGLVATATTSYNEPYNVARKFASLDHISHGRAGWNVVTSGNVAEAYNFGREQHFEHEERYARAREFVAVVKGLWDSWDDDAFIRDKESGRFFDPAKLHLLNHRGKFFTVRGPLNVPRPPQGYPVIFQAGTSESGRELCAAVGEGVFTSELTLAGQLEHYHDVKRRMARYGRRPEQMLILPGLTAVVGSSTSEAREKFDYLQSLIHPVVGRDYLGMLLGDVDLSNYSPDDQIPEIPSSTIAGQGTLKNIIAMARSEKLTIRQVYERLAGSRGKLTLVGSVTEVADTMQEWFTANACDGFILQPSYLPGELNEICELLLPELQSRGLVRVGYTGRTLREHMGLQRAPSCYADCDRGEHGSE
ncbi:MAG TPA: LLM class flavin-dependent oxidoreductase [Candidatus Binataceae bacterium]|nr:LLM class flavin-dependent oxidoreductase [Candidatus Binataceae bacterium]